METKKTKVVKPPVPVEIEEAPKVEAKEIQAIETVLADRTIQPTDMFGKLKRSQVELIKNTVAKGANDDELRLFLAVCHGAQLNPFLRQAHLVPFWDGKVGGERRAIIVGIDGFRTIAESSGKYAGNDDIIFAGEGDVEYMPYGAKTPKKVSHPGMATATVYKMIENQRFAFAATARWDEYYPGEKKGMQWLKMPYLMLGKCAEALALRKAFPKQLSGIYAQEEMDQATVEQPEQRQQKNFQSVMILAEKSSIAEVKKTMEKIAASDKYTPEQKTEFMKVAEARIAAEKGKDKA